MMPSTPTIDDFLSSVHNFLRSRDAVQLRGYILVEPPLPGIYATLTTEIRQAFPPGSGDALERKCSALLPEDLDRRPDDEMGTSWSSFVTFMRLYFEYLRDVNVANLLDTHGLLSGLTKYVPKSDPTRGRRGEGDLLLTDAHLVNVSRQ
jgi:hypothetical protein